MHGNWIPVKGRLRALTPDPSFLQNRLFQHAEDGFAVAQQRDQGPPQRFPRDERFRPVDWIKHPQILVFLIVAFLLQT